MTRKELSHLFLITIIFIAACIETDIYLPAFPDMMDFFNTSEEVIQSLLTWNFIGICLSGPIYGPLSDVIGRRKPLLFALTLFGIGSAITLFSDSFELMRFGRVLQGLGSGGCFTLGTAIVFDAFSKDRAIFAINQLNVMIPVVMAMAPLAGGFLNERYGFRSNFLAIAIFVGLSLAICLVFFKETLEDSKRVPLNAKKIAKDFKRALTSEPFWLNTMYISLLFGIYMSFLSTISVLFVLELGVDKGDFPYYQTAVLGAWVAASLSCSKVRTYFGDKFKTASLFLCFIGGALFCLLAIIYPTEPKLTTAGMMLFTVGFNFSMLIYFNECMQWLLDIKGIAASLLTSARLLITAVVIGANSAWYNKTIIPFTASTAVILLLCLIMVIRYEKLYAKKLRNQ
jgi:MFS transporter, DHA1 family, multidrug resistance protein